MTVRQPLTFVSKRWWDTISHEDKAEFVLVVLGNKISYRTLNVNQIIVIYKWANGIK
jgi:hypothetical protein